MKHAGERSVPLYGAPKHPWFSMPRAGLIVWRMPPRLTNGDISAGITALGAFLAGGPAVSAWIVDMSDVEEITPTQRKMFADNEQRIAPLTKLYVSRLAYVVPNHLVRALLTAYFWIWDPPYPYKIFARRDHAEAWALGGK